MPKVELSKSPVSDLGNAGGKKAVEFEVDKPRGQLEVSTGGVKWIPRGDGGRKRNNASKHVTWKKLVELLDGK